jgi:hypothetical protein
MRKLLILAALMAGCSGDDGRTGPCGFPGTECVPCSDADTGAHCSPQCVIRPPQGTVRCLVEVKDALGFGGPTECSYAEVDGEIGCCLGYFESETDSREGWHLCMEVL